jgi:signal transduction histidine kinase
LGICYAIITIENFSDLQIIFYWQKLDWNEYNCQGPHKLNVLWWLYLASDFLFLKADVREKRLTMFQNLFRIPDTFDPDDRRRRQILNILLIVILVAMLIGFIVTIAIYYQNLDSHSIALIGWSILGIVVLSILLLANRSHSLPGWLSAAIFIGFLIAAFTQVDTPGELYNGRSLVVWVIPIMIGAVTFRRPAAVFAITIVIVGLMQVSPPPNNVGVNYYAMLMLFSISFISWLGMSIANRAIRDARRHAANNEAILKNIADGVLVLDQQGRFVSANPALLKMIPEDELTEVIAGPLEKTIRWKRKVFSVSISEVPEIGTVAVFRDETRRFETERARDSLLATASHELRTPLTAVMNYLEMLQMLAKMDKINTDEFNTHITRALENLKRLQGLVNDILDQAQIQAGVLTLKHEPFNLGSLLEKAHKLLEVLLKEKSLSYELAIAPNVPAEISGDASRLNQVLVNLLGNAIKFTNQGGIKVNVSMPLKEKLLIEVMDSGPGISPEQLPDIFEAFRRGSNYAQRERQGAGLGLSIAKEIVTRMGGEISVSSEPGNGSIFTILLPMEAT